VWCSYFSEQRVLFFSGTEGLERLPFFSFLGLIFSLVSWILILIPATAFSSPFTGCSSDRSLVKHRQTFTTSPFSPMFSGGFDAFSWRALS